MTYVALLRGINVGGKSKVEMARLKLTFEQLGFENVKPYINSGNVIFNSDGMDEPQLVKQIEAAITKAFKLELKIVLRNLLAIKKLVQTLPADWVNNNDIKCDVMFLRPDVDKPSVIKEFPYQPALEQLRYVPGAVLWRVERKSQAKSRIVRIVGSNLHRNLTIRNPNTVRKLYELMLEAAKD